MFTDRSFYLHLNWVLDLSTGRLTVSQGLERLLGKPLGSLDDLTDQLEPISASRLRLWLAELEQDPEPGEVPLTFKDRRPAVYVAHIEPLYADGELISVQARLMPILAMLQDASADAEPPEDVCPQGCLGIVITDPVGRIRDCNPVFCHMIGLRRGALLDQKLLDYVHPADRDRPITLYDQLRDGNIETHHVEKRYQQADGSYFWAEVVIAMIREANGEIKHCVRFILNLSEHRQLEAELAQQKQLVTDLESELVTLRKL